MLFFISHSPKETESLGEKIGALLESGDILAYRGDLGAGKTAFTRGLARGLSSPASVSSPTFALVHEYQGGRLTLFHFDMYRLSGEDDLYDIGFYDCLDTPHSVFAIEWSERITGALAMPHITVSFAASGECEREITITGGDERLAALRP